MITIVGLGPGELDRVPAPARSLLLDPGRTVVARTEHHPSARQLGDLRDVVFCDDLYESGDTFEDVYEAIVGRVVEASKSGHVVYAVPGSPMVGEFAVRKLLATNLDIEVIPGESFVDAILAEVDCDPLDRGLQILNGHHLADPLVLDKPTIIGQLDRPEILADVCASVDRVTVEGTKVKVLVDLGATDAVVTEFLPEDVDSSLAGFRTSIFIDAEPGGLLGAVRTMRRLRTECPWDKDQTHRSLIKNLVEESYELIDAIRRLDEDTSDLVAYAEVEDELGDVLLQVLFHSVIAREKGVFDIDDVAEVMRQKLVRRHPHVFGDVQVASAAEVKANWDRIKKEERGETGEESALDGVPAGMPGLHRAAKIQNRAAKAGFDWGSATQMVPKINQGLGALSSAMSGDGDAEAELGDVLFSVVNLARQLDLDAEVALRGATDRFEERFRRAET
ncbi:MAG: nucleoside triphosphate pyrophosphohydrolase [Acidimicrobiia bacterium]